MCNQTNVKTEVRNSKVNTNTAEVRGVLNDIKFHHEYLGEQFYTAAVVVNRVSGTPDTVPCMVSDRLISENDMNNLKGHTVQVTGDIRSYNKKDEDNGKNHLELFLFAKEFIETSVDSEHINNVVLAGYVCKEPRKRTTPLGRDIADIMLAVNRQTYITGTGRSTMKSDYIPCIVWGRNATYAERIKVGSNIELKGRFQSRIYAKSIQGTEEKEEKMAFEMSASRITVFDTNDNTDSKK